MNPKYIKKFKISEDKKSGNFQNYVCRSLPLSFYMLKASKMAFLLEYIYSNKLLLSSDPTLKCTFIQYVVSSVIGVLSDQVNTRQLLPKILKFKKIVQGYFEIQQDITLVLRVLYSYYYQFIQPYFWSLVAMYYLDDIL